MDIYFLDIGCTYKSLCCGREARIQEENDPESSQDSLRGYVRKGSPNKKQDDIGGAIGSPAMLHQGLIGGNLQP